MFAKYILRLDDAHPNMDLKKWEKIEHICLKYNFKPIVSIIPDNKDESLNYSTFNDKFWELALKWQSHDWKIALHGYQHLLRKTTPGIIKINNYSEFVGYSSSIQKEMMKKGYEILIDHGLKPQIWVAPAHGSDYSTIQALLASTDIRMISDGLSTRPYNRFNLQWIPQQLWQGKSMLFGTWTICLHPNNMSLAAIDNLEKFAQANKKKFIAIDDLSFSNYSLYDSIVELSWLIMLFIKRKYNYFCNKFSR